MTLLILVGAQLLPFAVVIAAGASIIGLSRPEVVRLGVKAVLALAATVVLVWVAGKVHSDPRPFVVDPSRQALFVHAADDGFPSDHTAFSMAAALVVATVRRRYGLLLAGLAALSGLCRVWANVHHLQDIVASVAIALVAVLAAEVAMRMMRRRRAHGSQSPGALSH